MNCQYSTVLYSLILVNKLNSNLTQQTKKMEVESGSEAMVSCDEVPEAKRRKLSADADLDLDAMKVSPTVTQ